MLEFSVWHPLSDRIGVKMENPPSDRYLDSIGPETRTMWYEVSKMS